MNIEALIKAIKKEKLPTDIALVKKAYKFAEQHHEGKKRVSGEEFIQHPLEVAKILAEHGMDVQTIAAALLHGTVEDAKVSVDLIKKEFGEEIANLVDGVTKIKKLHSAPWEEQHAESIRKMIMASARDIRVIFIKLADKLHNMRTLKSLPEDMRLRISREVMDVYAPIAYKMGISSIKSELEDLAFGQLSPEAYKDIQSRLKRSIPQREKDIAEIKSLLGKELEKNKIQPVKMFGRPKHIYSIYRKMTVKGYAFEDIYDLIALRIITKTVKECYEIIGIIHQLWPPLPKKFKDYIATPKSNLYQSLHTTVMVKGQPAEIQVRTGEMDKIAENGIAAHWQYKGVYGDREFDAKLGWLKQILEWQKELKDSKEFMEMLKVDFFEDEIYTFTPKGEIIQLPKGACVLDFAYAVHSNIGDHCTGARINGKFVPMRAELKNGDQVEIVISKAQKPSREWLKIVITPKAKTKIKQKIREIEKIPVKCFTVKTIGKTGEESCIIEIENMRDPEIHMSHCCNPLPGEPIAAFASGSGKVAIHKEGCPNAKKAGRGNKRPVCASWVDAANAIVEVKVEALNRIGLFAEILNSIIAMQTQMKSAGAKPLGNNMIECNFTIESKSLAHLREIIKRVNKIKDVKKVYIGSVEKS